MFSDNRIFAVVNLTLHYVYVDFRILILKASKKMGRPWVQAGGRAQLLWACLCRIGRPKDGASKDLKASFARILFENCSVQRSLDLEFFQQRLSQYLEAGNGCFEVIQRWNDGWQEEKWLKEKRNITRRPWRSFQDMNFLDGSSVLGIGSTLCVLLNHEPTRPNT